MRVNRNQRGPHYRCDGMARCDGNRRFPECGEYGHQISAKELDRATWGVVERVLTNPQLIASQIARVSEQDPTEADLAALDRSLREVTRQEGNVASAVATMDNNPAATEALLQRLAMLADQRKMLQAERERVLGQRSTWAAALKRLDSIEGYCCRVAANLGTLSYEERRDTLDVLGVRATVHRKQAQDSRYIITADLDLVQEATLLDGPTTVSTTSTPSSMAMRRRIRKRSTASRRQSPPPKRWRQARTAAR